MTDTKLNPFQLIAETTQQSNLSKRYKKTHVTISVANQSGNVENVVLPQYNRALFLQKTHFMITQCDEKIAKWALDGNGFMIMNVEKFEKEIIPQYFGHSNFSSFERQLNYYSFEKVQDNHIRTLDFDDDTKVYASFKNENFKRDRPDLISNMQRRTKTKGWKTQSTLEELEAKVTKLNQNIDALNTKLVIKETGLRPRLIALERLILEKGYEISEPLTLSISHTTEKCAINNVQSSKIMNSKDACVSSSSLREEVTSRLMSITKCVIALKERGVERRLSNVFREVPCTNDIQPIMK